MTNAYTEPVLEALKGDDVNEIVDFVRLLFHAAQRGSSLYESLADAISEDGLTDRLAERNTNDKDVKTILTNLASFIAVTEIVYKIGKANVSQRQKEKTPPPAA